MFFLLSETLDKMIEGSFEKKIMAVESEVSKKYPDYTLISTYPNHAILFKEGKDDVQPDFLRVTFSLDRNGVILESFDRLDFSNDIVSEDDILLKSADRLVEAFIKKDGSLRNHLRSAMLDLIESDYVDFDYVERVMQKLDKIKDESSWQIHLSNDDGEIERRLYESAGYYRKKFYTDSLDMMENISLLRDSLKTFEEDIDKLYFTEGNNCVILDEVFVKDFMDDLRESISIIDMLFKIKDESLIQNAYDCIESKFSDFDIAHRIVLEVFDN